jgi:hypothetical protein
MLTAKSIRPGASFAFITETDFETQEGMAAKLVDGVFIAPSLATEFADEIGATGGDGRAELLAQIEIPAQTFSVGTLEAQHGFGVSHIHGVFD